jgi:tetratricopeptide (TPR) repeat protein
MKSFWLATAATLMAAPLCAQGMTMAHDDMAAPKTPTIMEGYGGGGFPITTANPKAQAFFDNGMQLAHAFAHKAAIEAMTEAVRLDPQCAMCLWGQAWASGPTINYNKTEDEITELAGMADKAADLAKANGTERERQMIHALQLRYKDGGGGKDGDLHFAKAMAGLASRYPDDKEIAVIAADAWLMTHAETAEDWQLNAELAMPLLERVLKTDPNYTPAIHFYIHATEIAKVPALAEPYADRLATLAPKASHLVHMPSHTYYWVGRYEDAAKANMRAVELGIDNAKRLGLGPPDGVWGLPYHSHNVTFGLGGALEAGDADIALRLGRPLVQRATTQTKAAPYAQMIAANGYYALARFADPAEVLALPEPKLPILQAAWHYARGEAFARKNDIAAVRKEAAAIRGLSGELNKDDGSLQAHTMTYIARNVLSGRAAMMEHRPADAAIAFAQAAELQEGDDFSSVSDPPAWHYPIRRDLAAALLDSGDAAGARREVEAALKYRPRDPDSLTLLSKLETRTAAR